MRPQSVFDNYVVDVEVGGKYVELALWDTIAREEYDRLRPLDYSGAHVILICFTVDSPDSLYNVEGKVRQREDFQFSFATLVERQLKTCLSFQWISEVMHFCAGLPIILVCCKKDLRCDHRVVDELMNSGQRPVSLEEGMAVAEKIGARHYLECSAKSGEGVREVFRHAARLFNRPGKKHCVIL